MTNKTPLHVRQVKPNLFVLVDDETKQDTWTFLTRGLLPKNVVILNKEKFAKENKNH